MVLWEFSGAIREGRGDGIDMNGDLSGESRVIECEVVEPELYLDLWPAAADRLAGAI